MKFNFGIILAAFTAALLFESSEAAIGAPNSFNTPPPSSICAGNKRLQPADGTQLKNGFCSSQVQGEIPSANKMTSTLILFPQSGSFLQANKNFTAKVKSINLNTGFFSDAATDYYDLPQQLGANGAINGHNHITIQALDGENSFNVPDPSVFAFFKGLNDPADGFGVLSQEVGTAAKPGLPAGCYRMCTMTSSFTHQPLIMPVAQRGSQDDCVRFTVK